jgi:hypothetical protein
MPLVSFRRGQFFSCKTCVASDSGLEAIRFIFLFNSQFATTIVFHLCLSGRPLISSRDPCDQIGATGTWFRLKRLAKRARFLASASET